MSLNLTKPKFSPLFLILVIIAVFVTELTTLHLALKETFHNNLPDIVVAKRGKPIEDSYLRNYEFTEDWFTMNIPVWEKVLSPFKGKENINYLEIGAFEGRSVIWMLENILTCPTSRVTAIDIFQSDYKERYYNNIQLSGRKVTTIENYSQIALRELPLDSFDIIYIDVSHKECDVLEDSVLSWRLLKEGGFLIFDDYRYIGSFNSEVFGDRKVFPKLAIDAFIQCFDKEFEVIHNDYQLIKKRKSKGEEK